MDYVYRIKRDGWLHRIGSGEKCMGERFMNNTLNRDRAYGKKLILITFLSLLIISSTAAIVRKDSREEELQEGIPAAASGIIQDNVYLNKNEFEILSLLKRAAESKIQKQEEKDFYYIYFNALYQHLCRSDINLSSSIGQGLKESILKLKRILQTENTWDIDHMSLDTRTVAIYLLEDIYRQCGLNIGFNVDSAVIYISDDQGNTLYGNTVINLKEGINLNAFAVIISILFLMLAVCYMISRKKQLFVKEVMCDGLDEKGYA